MTRDELQSILCQMSDCIYHREKSEEIMAHDARQRATIERLEAKVKAYEGGCLHDSLVDQAQEIARLREALKACQDRMGCGLCNTSLCAVCGKIHDQAHQLLKETP